MIADGHVFLLAGFFYFYTVPVANELQVLSFVISPQAAAMSVVKIIVSIVCVSFGIAMLTVLKEGPIAAYKARISRCPSKFKFLFYLRFLNCRCKEFMRYTQSILSPSL